MATLTPEQVRERAERELAALREIAAAAEAVHQCEDFSVMPCQHECCAPASWTEFQATRRRLANALADARWAGYIERDGTEASHE